jgi:ribonuclease P protein component
MLPRQHRLQLRQHPTFFTQAYRVATPCVSGFYQSAPGFRVAVIVPKKVAPLAVQRHRIKRLIHHSLQNIQNKPSLSLVISVKKGCLHLSLTDWQKEMEQVLSKIKYQESHVSDRHSLD